VIGGGGVTCGATKTAATPRSCTRPRPLGLPIVTSAWRPTSDFILVADTPRNESGSKGTTATRPERNGERRRAELADFLRTRRASLQPEHVGLPNGGRRRTPGLRREEVAQLAGVRTTWYTWLE
jgi:hypothetical protein